MLKTFTFFFLRKICTKVYLGLLVLLELLGHLVFKLFLIEYNSCLLRLTTSHGIRAGLNPKALNPNNSQHTILSYFNYRRWQKARLRDWIRHNAFSFGSLVSVLSKLVGQPRCNLGHLSFSRRQLSNLAYCFGKHRTGKEETQFC